MPALREEEASTAVFKALADGTRRQILAELRRHELAAGEVASRFTISGPSVSRHLSVLKAAGLVRERREANRIIYSLVPEQMALLLTPFLSSTCPELLAGASAPPPRKKKGKSSSKQRHKAGAGKGPAGAPPATAPPGAAAPPATAMPAATARASAMPAATARA